MDGLGRAMWPDGFRQHWQFVQGPENHDIVLKNREMRIARLGHADNPRSWYGRSRARVATGIGLTAPGIPMLFMGQEFLEDKQWSDDIDHEQGLLLYWDGLHKGDKQMVDHLRFARELMGVRWNQPALRGQGFRVVHAHNENRVLAFHRWVEGEGRDVLVVVHLSPNNRFNYRIGFPGPGFWREVFNSDVYENWVNPNVAGNGTGVNADQDGMHGFAQSASLLLPANSILIFAR
jgi:1,4-alpha-glucan branching enzyme